MGETQSIRQLAGLALILLLVGAILFFTVPFGDVLTESQNKQRVAGYALIGLGAGLGGYYFYMYCSVNCQTSKLNVKYDNMQSYRFLNVFGNK